MLNTNKVWREIQPTPEISFVCQYIKIMFFLHFCVSVSCACYNVMKKVSGLLKPHLSSVLSKLSNNLPPVRSRQAKQSSCFTLHYLAAFIYFCLNSQCLYCPITKKKWDIVESACLLPVWSGFDVWFFRVRRFSLSSKNVAKFQFDLQCSPDSF